MSLPSVLEELVEALRCLPGVGPKSAQRMAYHLLQRDQKGARRLARALEQAVEVLRHCSRCNAFSENEVCERCASPPNRNFEVRQGQGGRTHLVSPAMAAAATCAGHFVDVRTF